MMNKMVGLPRVVSSLSDVMLLERDLGIMQQFIFDYPQKFPSMINEILDFRNKLKEELK